MSSAPAPRTFAELRKAATARPCIVVVADEPVRLPLRHGRYAVEPPVAPLQKAAEDYEDALLKAAEHMATEPLEKFDESKVERDGSGRFAAKVAGGGRSADYGFKDGPLLTAQDKRELAARVGVTAGIAASLYSSQGLLRRDAEINREQRAIREGVTRILKDPKLRAKLSRQDVSRIKAMLSSRSFERGEISAVIRNRILGSMVLGGVGGYFLADPVLARYRQAKDQEESVSRLVGAAEGAGGSLALAGAIRAASLPFAQFRAGKGVAVLPSGKGRFIQGAKRALPVVAAGALLGGLGARRPMDEGGAREAAYDVGHVLRTAGRISAGAAIGELAGVGGQLALAAATKGRFRGAALPKVGGAVGGGLATVAALDLSSRHRNREASSGS